jgi:hypothetical protein
MNTNQIESQFSAMGARFQTRTVPENRRGQSDHAMDIQRDRHGEFFELRVPVRLPANRACDRNAGGVDRNPEAY